MSNKNTQSTMLAISSNSKILALFAIACTGLVGLINELTKDKIKEQEQLQLLSTLNAIIEPSSYDNDIANDCISISSELLGSNDIKTAYIARKQNNVVAFAMTSTAPNGYSGNIELIVGININAKITGVRVLKHKETPGLGDKIEINKNDWVTIFNGKTLTPENDSRWTVIKDGGMFDQFTGATITPRAVVIAVKNTLSYFQTNKQSLLKKPNTCITNIVDSSLPKGNKVSEVANEQ
jgi:electron transport complex protein RnfG